MGMSKLISSFNLNDNFDSYGNLLNLMLDSLDISDVNEIKERIDVIRSDNIVDLKSLRIIYNHNDLISKEMTLFQKHCNIKLKSLHK